MSSYADAAELDIWYDRVDVDDLIGYFVEDTELVLPTADDAYEVEVATAPAGGYAVTVTAAALAKDLMLFPDRLDAAARVDTGLVTLLAGESHTFTVTGADLDDAALTALEAEVAAEVAEAATWAEAQPDAEPHEALRQTWAEFDATVPAWAG